MIVVLDFFNKEHKGCSFRSEYGRIAGISDVIVEGENGFLVAEHDVQGMTEKMLLANKALAMQLGKKGKERIKNNFTMERHLKVIDELINNVISKNK